MRKDLGISIDFRSENKRLILGFLQMNGPSSREEICKQIGLPNSTTSYILNQLRIKGLIYEVKGKSRTRGPKPVIVDINTKGAFTAGAAIYPSCIYAALFTINLDPIEIAGISLRDIPTPTAAIQVLTATLLKLMNKHNILPSQLISLGITLPGLTLPNGVVSNSSPLYWHNIPFKKIVSEYFQCHITISRQIHVKNFLLEAFSDALKQPVIFHTTIGDGVGGTLIRDGKVIFGDKGLQGEIGHIIIEPNGPLCGCGNRGCLESLISGASLARRIKNDIKNGVKTSLVNLIKKDSSIRDIIRLWGIAVREGDGYAIKLRNFVGECFSRVIAIAITCYAPNTIILDGYVAEQCSDYLSEKIREKIKTDVCSSQVRDIRILVAFKDEETNFLRIAAKEALWELVQKV